MTTNEVRDAIVRTYPNLAGGVMARDQVVEKWCRDHGKSKDSLDVNDLLTIRALPEWQSAG
jgi:hypothetical protein